ncbi:MAG: hypothetical protein K2M64_01010 [Clostridia bacterium]|nr:hypothetical protein [Clostridia bacterium]
MGKYKKCPRCELNYILADEEMCDVCKAELGLETKIVLLDDIIDDEEPLKLCPVCKTNYISMDEKMCETCFNHSVQEDALDDDNDDWRTYLDDDETNDVDEEGDIPLEELDKEFGAEDDEDDEFEDEENLDSELDDFDDFADISDLDDIDDDEEEDADDDDDF